MKTFSRCVLPVMTPWCREEVPVEGNFGQTFDLLNSSIDLLSREFSTDLVLEVRAVTDWLFGGLHFIGYWGSGVWLDSNGGQGSVVTPSSKVLGLIPNYILEQDTSMTCI